MPPGSTLKGDPTQTLGKTMGPTCQDTEGSASGGHRRRDGLKCSGTWYPLRVGMEIWPHRNSRGLQSESQRMYHNKNGLFILFTGDMDSKLHNFRFQFLLLLWLCGLTFCTQTVPPNLTPAQWFQIQHIHPSSNISCNSAMRMVNSYTGHCKGKNTFLHVPFPNAVSVCHTRSRRCLRSPRKNCHKSKVRVHLTDCNLTGGSHNFSNCRYKQKLKKKFFVIACTQRSPEDSPAYQIVPVHLDGTV